MNITLLLLQAGTESDAAPVLAEAAQRVFPDVTVHPIKNLSEASSSPAVPECIILVDPREGEAQAALAVLDLTGLPRWPVLLLGPDEPNGALPSVPRAEWSPVTIARALRLALSQHASRREILRARGDLSTVAQRFNHDLRSQLGGIITTTELLNETWSPQVPRQASPLQPIVTSTEATTHLLERITFVLRATVSSPKLEGVDMGMAFWAAVSRLETQLNRNHVHLDQPARWPHVTGTIPWLETIWSNLLTNAIQHAGPSPRVQAGWDEGPAGYRFWVKDNGRGVHADKRRQLFHPLHRLHETNAPAGLGLPIVQRLVDLHGGHCGYEPLQPAGSCFFFSLPRAEAAK